MTLTLGKELVELLPSGVAVVQDALVVADLHLGKERAFRQQGVSVPDGPSEGTLKRLGEDLEASCPSRLIFLGDLFHHQKAIAGTTIETLQAWLAKYPKVHPLLVKGNHDRIPLTLKDEIETVPFIAIGNLFLFHHLQEPNIPHLAGHWHPSIQLKDQQGGFRLKCFWLRGERLVLPAYGEFTGSMDVELEPGDEVFVPHGGKVRKVRGVS